MTKTLFFIICFLFVSATSFGNDYDKAWEALNHNNRELAIEHLEKAMQDPATAIDAYITYIYVKSFEGGDATVKDFNQKLVEKVKDANPYLFAMWFNSAALGAYGKKTEKHQLELIDEILNNDKINGSLKSAARYVKAMHLMFSNQYQKAKSEWDQIGGVDKWQLVGPFENLSGSGFYKSYGPLEHPEQGAEFKSLTNATVNWFVPANMNKDGWTFLQSHFAYTTGIVYAQSFVYSPSEVRVVLNAGVNGSLKIWLNDAPVISESKERVTELDCYKAYCDLKKGYNRILVQVGFTNNTIPNFIVRLTDEDFNTIPGLKYMNELQPYNRQANDKPGSLKHFAESYFENKIKEQPNNFVNYILLSQTYLRNQKTYEARKIIQQALLKDPENSLLRFELMQCFLKEDNRTLLSQEIERIKDKDSGCYLVRQLNLKHSLEEEKYQEASEVLNRIVATHGEDDEALKYRINILISQNKMDEAVQVIQRAYTKYPDNKEFVNMMYNLNKNGYKDINAAFAVYEKFLKDNFDFSISKDLGEEYIKQGKKEKGFQVLNKLSEMFPYDADFITDIARLYFDQQDYKKALDLSSQVLALAPYVATYWNNQAVIYEQLGKVQEASAGYSKAIYYDSKRYESRKSLRLLQKKTDLYKVFPETDVYELIKNSATKTVSQDYNYYYLLDEKFAILYAEGAVEQYSTLVIKINNEKGIDTWKDSYIPYNEYTQSLLIEKAEVVKKNGNKLTAEQNDNEMVFTSLEPGDVVVIKYRLQNFARGRLAREFWDRYTFEAFVPSDVNRYCLLVEKNVPIDFKLINTELRPAVKDIEDYKLYTWESKNLPAVTDETFMPPLSDIAANLHISTIKSWNDVAKWYSDISYARIDDEYELREVYDQLFPSSDEKLSEVDKARRIYNYVEKNIRYSSVPFRQTAYVPQKPSVTINTRLGDCKDVSSLFVSLAAMAGLKANLVLVETKDNGTKEMVLPSVEFNHCIVFLRADGKEFYLELTDNNLPFASLPDNLIGAASLIIPKQTEQNVVSDLRLIKCGSCIPKKIKRVENITINGNDLKIAVEVQKSGAQTSAVRDEYGNLSVEKQKEEVEKTVSSNFKNPVKVETVSFTGLDTLVDSVKYNYVYSVKDEVVEVGTMNMFKIPFGDVVATIDNFSKDSRKYPIEYWRYEDVDEYETIVNVKLPPGKKIIELPKDQNYSFNSVNYSIKFLKTGNDKVTVIRKAKMAREDIAPADYDALKGFFNNIIKIESKYIAFN
jgi:Flp pilus assembly protein TadD